MEKRDDRYRHDYHAMGRTVPGSPRQEQLPQAPTPRPGHRHGRFVSFAIQRASRPRGTPTRVPTECTYWKAFWSLTQAATVQAAFVWFPEGMRMEHGASAHTDVVVLFITNKKFDIRFVEKE